MAVHLQHRASHARGPSTCRLLPSHARRRGRCRQRPRGHTVARKVAGFTRRMQVNAWTTQVCCGRSGNLNGEEQHPVACISRQRGSCAIGVGGTGAATMRFSIAIETGGRRRAASCADLGNLAELALLGFAEMVMGATGSCNGWSARCGRLRSRSSGSASPRERRACSGGESARPLRESLGQVVEFERGNLSRSLAALTPPAGRGIGCPRA